MSFYLEINWCAQFAGWLALKLETASIDLETHFHFLAGVENVFSEMLLASADLVLLSFAYQSPSGI